MFDALELVVGVGPELVVRVLLHVFVAHFNLLFVEVGGCLNRVVDVVDEERDVEPLHF